MLKKLKISPWSLNSRLFKYTFKISLSLCICNLINQNSTYRFSVGLEKRSRCSGMIGHDNLE